MTQTIAFSGIHCEACVKLITKRLQKIPGISTVNGDLSGTFTITTTKNITQNELKIAMAGTTYEIKN